MWLWFYDNAWNYDEQTCFLGLQRHICNIIFQKAHLIDKYGTSFLDIQTKMLPLNNILFSVSCRWKNLKGKWGHYVTESGRADIKNLKEEYRSHPDSKPYMFKVSSSPAFQRYNDWCCFSLQIFVLLCHLLREGYPAITGIQNQNQSSG